jgi:hypothetical protein
VFVAYARKDRHHLERFHVHVADLKRNGVEFFDDRDIRPGDDWQNILLGRLNEADVVVLLVTSSFTASDFCMERELPRAMQRRAAGECTVLPLYVESVFVSPQSPLQSIQWVPASGSPIHEQSNRARAWRDAAAEVWRAIDRWTSGKPDPVPAAEEPMAESGDEQMTERNALIAFGRKTLQLGTTMKWDWLADMPLSVRSTYRWHHDDHSLYATARPLSKAHEKRVMRARHPKEWAWLSQNAEAVRFGDTPAPEGPQFTRLTLLLESTREEPVTISDIRATVLRRTQPLAGALAVARAPGETWVGTIGFDLDDPAAWPARRLGPDYKLGRHYTELDRITLAPGESRPLHVTALTRRSYCEWVIELNVDLDGETVRVVAQDDDRPFRSTAFADPYATVYQFDGIPAEVARLPGAQWAWSG